MAQKWVCDLVAQLLEEDGQGIYDYFLNRRSFLKSYYKEFDMRAFIGSKMNDIFNDPKNYDPVTDRLTPQGKAQMKNEILAIIEDEQALISRYTDQYDINSVGMFGRIEKWSQTPRSQWVTWEDNLLRGYEDVRGSIYEGLRSTLDTRMTLESGRTVELSANQMFEDDEYGKAFVKLIIQRDARIESIGGARQKGLIAYDKTVKEFIASDKSLGDMDLALYSMAFTPNKMVQTTTGMDKFSNFISGSQRRNFTSKEVENAVDGFVAENADLFRTPDDARAVGYMLLGRFDHHSIRTKEAEVLSRLNKTPQGRLRFFNRIVNQGYIDKEGIIKVAQKYMDEPVNIYTRINNAISTDLATTKMFGKKPFQTLANARAIGETVIEDGKAKADFSEAMERMDKLMNAMFNPGKLNTMDNRMFQLTNLGASIIKSNGITGAGLRTMGDATLGGLKYSMFTGQSFTKSVLQGIGITGLELEGKIIRNLGSATKKVAPNSLGEYIDALTAKLDVSLWANLTNKERRELTEVMLGTMADTVTRAGVYDGTWTPLTTLASRKGLREGGMKGVATAWSSNFSMLQLKETIGNVNSFYFSRKFRKNLVKFYNDPVINKYMNDLGFTKDALDLYRKLGGDTNDGAELDLRDVDWFKERGQEYKDFMRKFFVPDNLDDLRPDQIGMILDMTASMRQGDLLTFDKDGTLSKNSQLLVMEKLFDLYPDVAKKIELKDFVIKFQPDTHSAHVTITGDGFLKGGLAEDKQLRYAIRKTYETIREQEMRIVRQTVKGEYLKDGKVIPSKRKEVKRLLDEMYGGRQTEDGVEYRWGRKEDYYVANYYLDKFKDFERALFYEFASVKPSLELRIANDRIKQLDPRLATILTNTLAFKSASVDALYKYKNLMGMMKKHMQEGKMFSGKKMATYADAVTGIGLIALINGIAGNLYDKATDVDRGDVVDTQDLVRKGALDVGAFPFGAMNPSVVQTFYGRVKQDPINAVLRQMFSNDILVNKFTKDVLGEMDRAYGLERRKEARLKKQRESARKIAKQKGEINIITGKKKKDKRRR